VRRSFLLLCLALAACSGSREVKIEVSIPGPDSVDAPVARLGFVALPYDRDSVLRTFEAGNPRPEALTRALDSLFQQFRGPFTAYAAEAYRVQRLQQSLGRLKARLDSLPRAGAEYDSLYRRFTERSESLPVLFAARDRAQENLAVARANLGPRMDTLRAAISRWEDSTYRGYDSVTKALGSGLGREPIADSTGADGTARLRLPPGKWWIYARSWDAWDPNSEWYWNLPVTGDHLVLDRASGRRRPRY
jgi:hypothetical protein